MEEREEWGYESVKKKSCKEWRRVRKKLRTHIRLNLGDERNNYYKEKSVREGCFNFIRAIWRSSCEVVMTPSNWISLKVHLQDTWLAQTVSVAVSTSASASKIDAEKEAPYHLSFFFSFFWVCLSVCESWVSLIWVIYTSWLLRVCF